MLNLVCTLAYANLSKNRVTNVIFGGLEDLAFRARLDHQHGMWL